MQGYGPADFVATGPSKTPPRVDKLTGGGRDGSGTTQRGIVLTFFALVAQEFSSTKATNLGFTWEHHQRCRKGFEVRRSAHLSASGAL